MAYGYNDLQDSAVANTLFLNYHLYNRRSPGSTADTIVAAQWLDHDIGYPFDDIIGTDSTRRLTYAYNGDSIDEGFLGFGLNPPAVGILDLSASVVGAMYYNNSQNFSRPPAVSSPYSAQEFAHYLNFRWKDGIPLQKERLDSTINGDGYLRQVYPDSITQWPFNDAIGWTSDQRFSSDSRLMARHRTFTLAPGEEKCLDLALSYARDSAGNDLFASVRKLKEQDSILKQRFANANHTCLQTGPLARQAQVLREGLKLYPNPARNQVMVASRYEVQRIQVLDLSGRKVGPVHELGGASSYSLDVSQLPAGLYLLQVVHESGQYIQKRLMVE